MKHRTPPAKQAKAPARAKAGRTPSPGKKAKATGPSRPAPAKAKAVTPSRRPTVKAAAPAKVAGHRAGKAVVKKTTAANPSAGAGVRRPGKSKFEDALLALRNQMVRMVRNISASTLTSTKQAGEELADVGSDNFSRDIGLAMITEDGRKLGLIEEALERLDAGTYGVCTECGKRISEARLTAIPYAPLCVDCQGHQEMAERYSTTTGGEHETFRGDWSVDGEETDLPTDDADEDGEGDADDGDEDELADEDDEKPARKTGSNRVPGGMRTAAAPAAKPATPPRPPPARRGK